MMNPFGNNENIVQIHLFDGFGISFLRVAIESIHRFLCALYDTQFSSLNKYSKYTHHITRMDKKK